jgi:hypothetical protein
LVDTFLDRLNGTTLKELWGNNTLIERVTLGDVLHMNSGIVDYNDSMVWEISMSMVLVLGTMNFAYNPRLCQQTSRSTLTVNPATQP